MSNEELANAFRKLAEILTTHEGTIDFRESPIISKTWKIKIETNRGGAEKYMSNLILATSIHDVASQSLLDLIRIYDHVCGS